MRLLLHPMTMSCLKLPYQARVPVIRGLTRFLTMAEVALVQDIVSRGDNINIYFLQNNKYIVLKHPEKTNE